jgi:hypothetical protein
VCRRTTHDWSLDDEQHDLADAFRRTESASLQSGRNEHAFMVDAPRAREEVARCGRGVDADEAFDYLQARAAGSHARKPDPSSI